MATELKEAPVKNPKPAAKSPFGKPKKPDLIVYRLLKMNDRSMRDDTPEYPPYRELPNRDTILWNWGTEADPDWAERVIRYLRGFESIFVDQQEKDGRVIPENILHDRNNKFIINKGYIRIKPTEKQKMQFLDMCNWNSESLHRTGKVQALFARKSEEKDVAQLVLKQKNQNTAFGKAFNAKEEQIAFHAKYLGIPMMDHETGGTRTLEAVQADYRQKALDDPDTFLKTYDDPVLKLKYQIERALEDNFFSLAMTPNKITLVSTREPLMDFTEGNAVETIYAYCQTPEGEKLADRLMERE
jgi:hypothetical protein